jgi:hypothetical protein
MNLKNPRPDRINNLSDIDAAHLRSRNLFGSTIRSAFWIVSWVKWASASVNVRCTRSVVDGSILKQ